MVKLYNITQVIIQCLLNMALILLMPTMSHQDYYSIFLNVTADNTRIALLFVVSESEVSIIPLPAKCAAPTAERDTTNSSGSYVTSYLCIQL